MTTSKDATKKEAPWKTFGSLGEFKEAWGKGTVKEEKLNVPSNLALSGVISVARTYNIPFEAARFYTLKIDLGGRVVAFDWQAPANLYNNYFVGLKNVVSNSKTDFTDEALEKGIRDVLSYAIFEEIIEPDLDPIGTKEKDDEYRKQSEIISGEYLEGLLEEDEELAKLKNTTNTGIIPVTPIEGVAASISEFQKNPSNKVYGRTKVLGNPEEKIAAAKLKCSVCGSEQQHQVFDPPIDVGKINQHIVLRGRCNDPGGYCGRLNTIQTVKETVTVRNLVLADLDYPDTVLEIVDVREFDVMKGDIIKVEGDIEYNGKTKVLRCRKLEIIQRIKAAQPIRLSDHKDIKPLGSLEMKDNGVDDGVARCRIAVFSRYKKFYHKNSDSPDERFDLVIHELINEGNQDIKNLVTVKGVVKSNLRDNRQLQNFLDSLLVPQKGDDGVLVRTGTRPVKLIILPLKLL